MAANNQSEGSARMQGDLWGARARAWAESQEPQARPLFEEGIRRTGIGQGSQVLDVGCGAGGFCVLAAEAGARVTGIDAAATFVEIARERVPSGQFDVGDIQFLPYEDRSFDVVTGFNSFQYAADPVAAVREAGRVVKPGGVVLAFVWGREERTELVALLRALRPLLPPAPPNTPGPFALSNPGALEALFVRAGLTPRHDGYIEAPFEYPDESTLIGANRSSGPVVLAERTSGEAAVREALVAAFAPCRTSSGGYRIEAEWRYVLGQPSV